MRLSTMVIVALLVAGPVACAAAQRRGEDVAQHESPAGGVHAWTYPESSAWGAACEADPPATSPIKPPPTVQQSPIDFTAFSPPTQPLTVVVTPPATFEAHDQNVVFATSISLTPATDQAATYTTLGFHFHAPNEHVVAGIGRPAIELHIKTLGGSGTAVFAVLYNTDAGVSFADDPTLTAVQSSLESKTPVDLTPSLRRFQSGSFFSYRGSLTTPPCTSGIQWYVLRSPVTVPLAQLTGFTRALAAAGMPNANARLPRQLASPEPRVVLMTPSRLLPK
jgi:carbonic anhydrase